MAIFRQVRLAATFFSLNIREFMADRESFLLYLLTIGLQQALFFVFIGVVFSFVPSIEGWRFEEILFIYGYYTSVTGLFYMFFAWMIWFPDKYLLRRGLDTILTYPLPPYFCILYRELGRSVMEILSVFLGFIIMGYSISVLHIKPGLFQVLQLATAMLGSFAILVGIFSLLTASSFYLKGHASLASPVMDVIQFAQYPTEIYGQWIKALITYVFPIGYVAFYPSATILAQSKYFGFYPATLFWGVALVLAGYSFWNYALRRYESAGN